MRGDYGNWQKYRNPNPVQRWLLARFIESVREMAGGVNPSTVLDVGCAEGFVTDGLRQSIPDARIVGMDVDREALSRGIELGMRAACQGSAYCLPYSRSSFDLVLALEVLEHLEEPERALDELCRVARRYCLLSVPHEPFFRGANFLRGKHLQRCGNDPEHLHNWSFTGFLNLIGGYGTIQHTRRPFPWSVALLRCEEVR